MNDGRPYFSERFARMAFDHCEDYGITPEQVLRTLGSAFHIVDLMPGGGRGCEDATKKNAPV